MNKPLHPAPSEPGMLKVLLLGPILLVTGFIGLIFDLLRGKDADYYSGFNHRGSPW